MIGLGLWISLIAAGLVLEAVALKLKSKHWPTLTEVILEHVPKWAIAMVLGWLAYHFLIARFWFS